jgi:integrase
MKGRSFVLGTVRALFEWAADPDRGNLLPEGFRNPFRRRVDSESGSGEDPLKEPDISLEMALDFVRVCDAYQLRLFIPLLFFGLRASEPCFLFREYLEDLWLRVPCNPDLVYLTKGRRDKRFPLIESLQSFWNFLRAGPGQGLLYNRRSVYEGKELAPLQGRSLAELVLVFQQQVREAKSLDAAGRLRLRSQVLHEAGGMNYDDVQGEFEGLARRLGWSKEATLKDFRHLFCTTLENAAMPEAYRRYLMGHAPGKAAIMAYTHLNQLRQRYAEAIQREWQPLVEAINQRLRQIQVS